MKTFVLAVAIAAIPAGQTGATGAAGSWTAEFKGETFIRLELTMAGGRLGGTMSAGNVEVDKQGELSRVSAAPGDPKPIFDVVQQGSMVTFARKDEQDTDRFELRLLDSGRAELRFVLTDELLKELAADGIPAPKPFVLRRR